MEWRLMPGRWPAAGVLAALLMIALAVVAAPPQRVLLGTSTPGGGFSLFGNHLAAVVNAVDGALEVEPRATRGSRENLELLAAGALDIALVEGNAARTVLHGSGGEAPPLKVLWVMYPNPGMFVVRADSPYHTIGDLEGRAVAFGTRASGLRILARDVLDGLGLSPQTDFEQVILDSAGEGPPLVLSGEVAALWGAGIGWPGFVRVAESAVGARFIAPDAAQRERIRAAHPHLRPMTVPAGTYRGQQEPIHSLGLWALVLTRADLPEELGFRLVRALHRGEDVLATRLPQGRYARLAHAAAEVPPALRHGGLARYLEETPAAASP